MEDSLITIVQEYRSLLLVVFILEQFGIENVNYSVVSAFWISDFNEVASIKWINKILMCGSQEKLSDFYELLHNIKTT